MRSLLLRPPASACPRVTRYGKARQDVPGLLHQLADTATPAILRAVVQILREAGLSIPADQIADALTAGNGAAAIALLRRHWERYGTAQFQALIAPQLETLALQAAQASGTVAVRFNVQDPEALAAIATFVGRQIMAIDETTREAIRGILRRAFESGMPVAQQLQEIAALIGLTPRQAQSLSRYREGLQAAGVSPSRIQALVTRRAEALRLQRAEVIARTETSRAAHAGEQARWEQAVRAGLVRPEQLLRTWIVTLDDRLCPLCRAIPGLNPDGVGLDTPFRTPGGAVLYPPAHPQCRCALGTTLRR